MKTGPADPPEDDANAGESDRWTVADLIDLEYYLGADEQTLHAGTTARNALTERDRTLYLDRIAPTLTDSLPHTTRHRRLSLRRWLRERRAAELPQQRLLLPGHTFAQAQRLTALGLAVVGFLAGIGAASALLSYDGHRPINVALYIFLLVFVQFLLVGGATVAWLVRRARPVGRGMRDLSLLGRLIRPLVTRVSDWLGRQQLTATRQEVGDRTATQVGHLRAQYALYGPVSFLPMLIPAQVFGIAFNLGVILTTIGLEWFTDLAFGWATALDLSPQFVHDLTRTIATPWGWLFGQGVGYPSLEQVAGSRILLKDPLFLLDADHLRSWRWFLVLAVLTYGLLPRLLLLGTSLVAQRHLLERLPFTQGRTQALYARLLTPKVESATHGSGHGPAMPIPAPIAYHGPLARPIAGSPTSPPASPHTRDEVRQGPPAPVPAPPATSPQSVPAARGAAAPTAAPRPPTPAPRPEPPAGPDTRTEISRPHQPASASAIASTPAAALEPDPTPQPQIQAQPQPGPAPGPTPNAAAPAELTAAPRQAPAPRSTQEPAPRTPPEPERTQPQELAPPPQPEPELESEPPLAPAESEPAREPAPEPMTAPQGQSAAEPEPEPEAPPIPWPTAAPCEPRGTEVPGGIAADACLLLVQLDVDELIEDAQRPRVAAFVRALTGWRIAASASFGSGSAMTAGVVHWVEGQRWLAPPARVVVIMDGSQPPITENLLLLRELRAAAGTQAQVLLTLVGDPQDDDPLPPVRAFDFTDWQRKIGQLADPYLRLEQLAPGSGDGDA